MVKNFGQKSTFWSKLENLVTIEFFVKIEILFKNRNFWSKLENLVKNRNFGQKM